MSGSLRDRRENVYILLAMKHENVRNIKTKRTQTDTFVTNILNIKGDFHLSIIFV